MTGGGELMRRIPRIKFPKRHHHQSSPSSSVSTSETKPAASTTTESFFSRSSDVPAAPKDMAAGGKASLQPKRTPVTDQEIEAILLGGCF